MADGQDRLLLIANPAARRVRHNRHLAVASILSRRYEVETLCSSSPGQVREAASQAASRGVSVVAAMGGDGMVSRAVAGIAGTQTSLAIIPAGTANASARSLGIPNDALRAAEAIAATPVRRPVPLARLTMTGTAGMSSGYALSQVGIGFDAEVVRRVEQHVEQKRRLGELYFALTLVAVLTSWSRRFGGLRLRCGSSRSAGACSVVIQVRWPYTYLGPVRIALSPQAGDGLDVLVIERFTPSAVMGAVVRGLTTHSFHRCRGVQLWPGCDVLRLEAQPGMVALAEGEPLGAVDSMEVTWTRDGLLLANPDSRR